MKPHKHCELIKAWADGAKIQYWTGVDWFDCINNEPSWNDENKFRIKPEQKPDVVKYYGGSYVRNYLKGTGRNGNELDGFENLKLTFDGETGELKSAEVLK